MKFNITKCLIITIGSLLLQGAYFSFSAHAELPAELPPEIIQRSLVSPGDTALMQRVLAKARRGEPVTLAFIGGSITEGAKATTKEKRYPGRVGEWWSGAFPKAQIEVVNAGIGATGSDFGAMRFQRDVLSRNPDLVVVEFAVNDASSEAYAKTLEGIIRQALNSPGHPAVVLLFMMRKDGTNAQEWFSKVGEHYGLPMVSYRDALWPEIEAGRIQWDEISPDSVHPNDIGHDYVAQMLDAFSAAVLKELPVDGGLPDSKAVPGPLFSGLYEYTTLSNGEGLVPVVHEGWTFEKSATSSKSTGWKATQPGSVLEFETKGTEIFLQYWRIQGPMGKVRVTVDGGAPVDLDGWFEKTWGGYNSMQPVGKNLEKGTHRLRIELLPEKNANSNGTEFIVTGVGSAGAMD